MKFPFFLSKEKIPPFVVELHYKRPLFSQMYYIQSSKDIETLVRELAQENQIDLLERFWAVFCTHSLRVLAIGEISQGSMQGTVINIPYILQLALLLNAGALILVHNHPSGSLEFSKEDLQMTQKMKKATKLLSIRLLDHLILTSEDYVSMSDEGIL